MHIRHRRGFARLPDNAMPASAKWSKCIRNEGVSFALSMEPNGSSAGYVFSWTGSLRPPLNCRSQVSCKSVMPRTGRYLFGAFYKAIMDRHMDTTTLLIIIVVLLLLGGGWYGRGRWY